MTAIVIDDSMWVPPMHDDCTCPRCLVTDRARLIAIFDATLDAHCHVDIFANRYEDGLAVSTLRIWSESHCLPMRTMPFQSGDERCTATKVELPNASVITVIQGGEE